MSDVAIFGIGDLVHVVAGPFTSFRGVGKDVNEERSRLKVAVSIFGSLATVDLRFREVELV